MSFSFSRKLRDEIDSSFNLQAALLLLVSGICTFLNCYMLWKVWITIGHTGDQIVTILFYSIILIELVLIIYTMWLAAIDCNIANATWLAMYLTYCLYRYSMRSVEPECSIGNFTIGNLLYNFLSSIFKSNAQKCQAPEMRYP